MNLKNYLKPNWPMLSSIQAYSTTRLGGHSLPPFDTFNLAMGVGDQEKHVIANHKQLIEDLQLPSSPVWLNQIHSDNVVVLTKPPAEILSADAIITSQKNLVCAILTADCLPILLSNRTGTKVAAIHAGWRGIASGIIFETLKKMEHNQDNEIIAWLGPAIGPTAFEIGEKVKIALSDSLPSKDSKDCFKRLNLNPIKDSLNDEAKYLANLYQIATHHLIACGVQKIHGGQYCTYHQPDLFFSYRRASKANQGLGPVRTGRIASLIWLT